MRPAFPLLAAILLVGLAPGSVGGCPVAGDGRAVEVLDGHHLLLVEEGTALRPDLRVELWRETNGAEGLQALAHRCADGSRIAPDERVAQLGTQAGGIGL